jgi:hypothetical protein
MYYCAVIYEIFFLDSEAHCGKLLQQTALLFKKETVSD